MLLICFEWYFNTALRPLQFHFMFPELQFGLKNLKCHHKSSAFFEVYHWERSRYLVILVKNANVWSCFAADSSAMTVSLVCKNVSLPSQRSLDYLCTSSVTQVLQFSAVQNFVMLAANHLKKRSQLMVVEHSWANEVNGVKCNIFLLQWFAATVLLQPGKVQQP